MTEWTTGTLDIGYREKKKSEGMDIFQTKQLLPGFDTNGRSGRKTGDDNRKRYFQYPRPQHRPGKKTFQSWRPIVPPGKELVW